jgi:hypothetical protein
MLLPAQVLLQEDTSTRAADQVQGRVSSARSRQSSRQGVLLPAWVLLQVILQAVGSTGCMAENSAHNKHHH